MEPLLEIIGNLAGVHLRPLPPSTTLLVRTNNSSYRIVVVDGCTISVQGGTFFPIPTVGSLASITIERGGLKPAWIGMGCRMAIRTAAKDVVTSPVRAIAIEEAAAESSKSTSRFKAVCVRSPEAGQATPFDSALTVEHDSAWRRS